MKDLQFLKGMKNVNREMLNSTWHHQATNLTQAAELPVHTADDRIVELFAMKSYGD